VASAIRAMRVDEEVEVVIHAAEFAQEMGAGIY